MKKMTVRDILKKRKSNLRKTYEESFNPYAQQNAVDFSILLEKLLSADVTKTQQIDITDEERAIIMLKIEEKEGFSLNQEIMSENMIIWRGPIDSETVLPDTSIQTDSYGNTNKVYNNYFVLFGKLEVYEKSKVQLESNKRFNNSSRQFTGFATETEKNPQQPRQPPFCTVQEMTGWGGLFRRKQQEKQCVLVGRNVIVVEIINPQLESMLLNQGGMDQHKKAQIIDKILIFNCIGKRIQAIIPYIEYRRYSKSQYIYRTHQKPTAVYIIVKGEVVFEIKLPIKPTNQLKFQLSSHESRSRNSDTVIQTETLTVGNYFGEEEIINQTNRKLNAVCLSAECGLLEIPIEKIDKLFSCSDFYDQLKQSAEIRESERTQKLGKSLQIITKIVSQKENQFVFPTQNEANIRNSQQNRQKSHKQRSTEPVRIMHGKIIRNVSLRKNEQVSFSMLSVNPDMYEATLKKFRKYTMKQPIKTKPQLDWNLQRVWKVLNLENVLREDSQVTNPEGKKYYEAHRRLQNQVQQVKSFRPKTSSSTYKTKLQYVAYLQRFNN